MAKIPINLGGGGGAYSSDMTATLDDVVASKTAMTSDSNDEAGVGKLPDYSGTAKSATASLDTTNSRVQLTVPAKGKYDTASKLYAAYSSIRSLIGLTAAKIAIGNTILGLAGTYKGLGDAIAADVVAGKKFSTASLSNATGTMQTMAGQTITPSRSKQTVSCSGKKMTGDVVVNAIPDTYYAASDNPAFFRDGSYGVMADLGAYLTAGNLTAGLANNSKASITNSKIKAVIDPEYWPYLLFRRSFPVKAFSGKKLKIVGSVDGTWIGLSFRLYYKTSTGIAVAGNSYGVSGSGNFTITIPLSTYASSDTYDELIVGAKFVNSEGSATVYLAEVSITD